MLSSIEWFINSEPFYGVKRETFVFLCEFLLNIHPSSKSKLFFPSHQVSLIYKDASLGNPVHIAVVRMLLLKDQEFVLPSAGGGSDGSEGNGIGIISPELLSLDNRPGKSASEMLRNFCKWQKSFNDPDDNSDLHHDTALLLTRSAIEKKGHKIINETFSLVFFTAYRLSGMATNSCELRQRTKGGQL